MSITCWRRRDARRQPVEGASRVLDPAAHRSAARNGFVATSRAIVVAGPWPGKTRVSGGSVSTSMRSDAVERCRSRSPRGRCARHFPQRAHLRSAARPRRGTRRAPASVRELPAHAARTARSRAFSPPSRATSGGAARRSASPAGMYTRTPVAAATDATPPTWSTCPCVTRIALGSSPRAAISPRIRSGSAPGSTTRARGLGISGDQVAVGLIGTDWKGDGGEECDGGS